MTRHTGTGAAASYIQLIGHGELESMKFLSTLASAAILVALFIAFGSMIGHAAPLAAAGL